MYNTEMPLKQRKVKALPIHRTESNGKSIYLEIFMKIASQVKELSTDSLITQTISMGVKNVINMETLS